MAPRPELAGQASSADLLAEVIEVMSDGLALFDGNAVLLHSNSRFRTLNYLLADVLIPGVGWDMLLREAVTRGIIDVRARDRLRWMEARLDESPGGLESIVFESVNGAMMDVSLRPLANGGFVVTQTDITSRLLYEETEKQADLLLRKVLEACPANVVMSRIGDGPLPLTGRHRAAGHRAPCKRSFRQPRGTRRFHHRAVAGGARGQHASDGRPA